MLYIRQKASEAKINKNDIKMEQAAPHMQNKLFKVWSEITGKENSLSKWNISDEEKRKNEKFGNDDDNEKKKKEEKVMVRGSVKEVLKKYRVYPLSFISPYARNIREEKKEFNVFWHTCQSWR